MSKSIKEISRIAAEWWADKVIDPKMDNGDNSFEGFFGMTMAKMLVEPVSEETKTNFINNLAKSIEEKLSNTQYDLILGVDYGPDRILAEAAELSGISHNNFPIKTDMWIDKDHVSVRYGYGAKEEFLYANKAYWTKNINSDKEYLEEYKNGTKLFWIRDEKERETVAKERINDIEKRIIEYQNNLNKAEE